MQVEISKLSDVNLSNLLIPNFSDIKGSFLGRSVICLKNHFLGFLSRFWLWIKSGTFLTNRKINRLLGDREGHDLTIGNRVNSRTPVVIVETNTTLAIKPKSCLKSPLNLPCQKKTVVIQENKNIFIHLTHYN